MTAGEGIEVDQALVDRVRTRLENDGAIIDGTDKSKRSEVLRRAAWIAVEELSVSEHPITWATARTRPQARTGLEDPRDVLIGRLSVILGVADLGFRAASYDAILSAARALKGNANRSTDC